MITYALVTDKGEREVNEDSIIVAEKGEKKLFVVADGLGGHDCGEVASRIAVETAKELFENSKFEYVELIREIQNRLFAVQKENNNSLGYKTTFVSLEISDSQAIGFHVGDSRLYSFDLKSREKWSRSKDHSVPEVLYQMKEIKEKEMRHHPDRSSLLKVFGIEKEIAPNMDFETENVKEAYLLCTDGFWEWINEDKMIKFLKKSKSVDEWVKQMTAFVIKSGRGKGMDNFSAIGIWKR